jgi:hypothetical protein
MWRRLSVPVACLLLPAILAACTYRLSQPPGATQPTLPVAQFSSPSPPAASQAAPAAPGVTPTSPPDKPEPPRTQYLLNATLDYDQHQLVVEEKITYTNLTGETLNELVLVVEPNRYTGVFKLNHLHLEGGQSINDVTLDGNELRFPLPQSLGEGKHLVLSLAYKLFLPSPVPNPYIRPVPFGYTSRQTNLVDWYPFIPPYVPGQGWLVHKPGYFGEHLVYEMADFQVNIRIDGKNSVPSDSTPSIPTLTIAASATGTVDGDYTRFHLDNARNFVWSASHEYLVKSKTVGDVTIYGYSFPYHESAGDAALDTTVKALELYSKLFAPYPHSTLSVVEADFLDGMEFDGLYFLSNGFYNLYGGSPGEYLVDIAAHETAHQWWYALVGNDQAQEPWLDEALCTYTERLFYENVYPEALDWWWAYRIKYYQPQGWIDGSIYSYNYASDAYRAYRDAVYLNGAMFFEALRKAIGDEAFFAFLKDYAQQNAGKIANRQVFFTLLNKHTQVDLTTLINQYFETP